MMKRPGTTALLVSGTALAVLGVLMATDRRTTQFSPPVSVAEILSRYVPPRGYVCCRAVGPINVDGRLDEPSWQNIPWTEDFVDIEGAAKPKPRLRTRAKMLWDDRFFYIAAELEEPHVWATVTEHDAVIFEDNDFEIFMDPDGDSHLYAEFEMNALNTTWDLLLPMPYKDHGIPVSRWESGVKTGVHVTGTINNPSDIDKGWTVEIAFPWSALKELSQQPAPPRDGDHWRIDFSRVEWKTIVEGNRYRKVAGQKEDNWVWSPQGVVDMHRPETWGYVQFSTGRPGEASFQPDRAGPAKHLLHGVYYAEREFHKRYGRWASSLEELGISGPLPRGELSDLRLQTTKDLFEAWVVVKNNGASRRWHIRQDAKVWSD